MTYSTGSGDYVAMMAAVLAHAVADGWTTSGGTWPISKGTMGWVDWTSFTQSEADVTIGTDGATKAQRFLRLGLGATAGAATTNAASSNVQCANLFYAMTEWHIFSQPALNNHIHVVFRFNNQANSDCYSHFSFGEVDKSGFGYGSVNYVTAGLRRGYAQTNGANFNSGVESNNLRYGQYQFGGAVGRNDSGGPNGTNFMIRSGSAPTPNGTGGWPAHDTVVADGANLWGKVGRVGADVLSPADVNSNPLSLDFMGWSATQQPFSGAVTLMPMPFCVLNGTGVSNRMRWLGVFPNVRKCSMEGFNPGDEVTYGSETWKLFPLLRSTPNALMGTASTVTSGRAGFAYKKVA